jgi:hypothetical protein
VGVVWVSCGFTANWRQSKSVGPAPIDSLRAVFAGSALIGRAVERLFKVHQFCPRFWFLSSPLPDHPIYALHTSVRTTWSTKYLYDRLVYSVSAQLSQCGNIGSWLGISNCIQCGGCSGYTNYSILYVGT